MGAVKNFGEKRQFLRDGAGVKTYGMRKNNAVNGCVRLAKRAAQHTTELMMKSHTDRAQQCGTMIPNRIEPSALSKSRCTAQSRS